MVSGAARPNWKGDAASPQAARGRASRYPAVRCAHCGDDGSHHRLQRHHQDRNVYNNEQSNIKILCTVCHAAQHESTVAHKEAARRNILLGVKRGEANHKAKLTEQQVQTIRAAAARGASFKALAREYGLHYSVISRLVRRLTWQSV